MGITYVVFEGLLDCVSKGGGNDRGQVLEDSIGDAIDPKSPGVVRLLMTQPSEMSCIARSNLYYKKTQVLLGC